MKGIFVILDGVADRQCQTLGHITPLQAAKTPNLDSLSKKSKIDYCYTVKKGVAPESSSAVVSLLGYDHRFMPRGPLEAKGAGIDMKKGDLALRCNFATVDSLEEGHILDSRAGRTLTTKEAKNLAKLINQKVKLPYKFQFYATNQHRGVLLLRGGFSDNVTNADPFYTGAGATRNPNPKIVFSKPMDDEDDSKLTADLINQFIRKSHEVLDNHTINVTRAKKGLFAANFVLCRDAGNDLTKLKKLKGRWMALGYMPLEKGIAESVGMDLYKVKYPKLRNIDVYSNLYSGLKTSIKGAIKMIKKNKDNYDYFYVHFKETDIPGHDNKPHEKVKMIEMIDDMFFSFVKKFIGDKRLVVTADHTTASSIKGHTDDPVPVLTYPWPGENNEKRFTEEQGLRGKKIIGKKLLSERLFPKKFV